MSKHEDPDPLLDEIRETREQIWREHGNDLDRVIAHYMELQQQFSGQLISIPRPAPPKQDKSAA
jgi:hypothetical protein